MKRIMGGYIILPLLFLVACGSLPENVVWAVQPSNFEMHQTSATILFSPDASMLAVAGPNEVLVFDSLSGETVECFDSGIEGERGGRRDIAFTPDSTGIGIYDNDAIRVWDIDKEPNPLCAGAARFGINSPNSNVKGLVFSPDGLKLYILWDLWIAVYDLATEERLMQLEGHESRIYCLAISPDGQFLASGDNTSLRLWDAQTGEERWVASGSCQNELIFSPDGSTLINLGGHNYDVATGQETAVVADISAKDAAFSPDGKLIISNRLGASILNLEGDVIYVFEGHRNIAVWAVDYSSDGIHLASVDDTGYIMLWAIPATQSE